MSREKKTKEKNTGAYKPVKVGKAWDKLSDQRSSASDGNTWLITDIIDKAKDLPVLDMPIQFLNISQNIAGIPVRQFVAHMKMILDADLNCPIIFDRDFDIYDGRHRIAKAILQGETSIKVKRFEDYVESSFYDASKDKGGKSSSS